MTKKTKIILIVAALVIVGALIYWFNAGKQKANSIKTWFATLQKMIDTYVQETTTGLTLAAKPANLSKEENDTYEMLRREIYTEKKWATKAEIFPSHTNWTKKNQPFNVSVWL